MLRRGGILLLLVEIYWRALVKKTDFIRRINKEDRKYKMAKLKSYLRMKFSYGEKRRSRESAYSIFENDFRFDTNKNGLPKAKYYKPTDIIIYDLIKKEYLAETKNGLIKLFKKCYSHKYMWGGKSEQDIDNLIIGLDQKVNSGNSWYEIGIFDFAYNEKLDTYIDHFKIRFHNFSSSYAAIEVQIKLADSFVDELSDFIKKTYKKPGMCIHRYWGRKKGKTGAKIIYGVSAGVQSECAKSQIVYEQLQYVKSIALKEFKKYFLMMHFSNSGNVLGINVFETNIKITDRLDRPVYESLGLNDRYGFNISSAERLYVSTATIDYFDSYETDMLFVYNPDLMSDYQMFSTAHNKSLHYLTHYYLSDLYRIVILKDIGIRYLNQIRQYRNLVNKNKPYRRNHKNLLKIKYNLSKDFYEFKKIDDELPVNEEFSRAEQIIKDDSFIHSSIYHGIHTSESFYGIPRWIWKQIETNYNEVESDINRKIEISSSLTNYYAETINRLMVCIQVIIALATFYLLIFPNVAKVIAKFIEGLFH